MLGCLGFRLLHADLHFLYDTYKVHNLRGRCFKVLHRLFHVIDLLGPRLRILGVSVTQCRERIGMEMTNFVSRCFGSFDSLVSTKRCDIRVLLASLPQAVKHLAVRPTSLRRVVRREERRQVCFALLLPKSELTRKELLLERVHPVALLIDRAPERALFFGFGRITISLEVIDSSRLLVMRDNCDVRQQLRIEAHLTTGAEGTEQQTESHGN